MSIKYFVGAKRRREAKLSYQKMKSKNCSASKEKVKRRKKSQSGRNGNIRKSFSFQKRVLRAICFLNFVSLSAIDKGPTKILLHFDSEFIFKLQSNDHKKKKREKFFYFILRHKNFVTFKENFFFLFVFASCRRKSFHCYRKNYE